MENFNLNLDSGFDFNVTMEEMLKDVSTNDLINELVNNRKANVINVRRYKGCNIPPAGHPRIVIVIPNEE